MKAASLLVLGALLGSIVLVPFAAFASDGLVALVFVTPPNAAVGETVDVNVETSVWGVATSVDNLTGMVGLFGGTDLNFTVVAAGKYHASYMIQAADVFYGSISVSVTADLGLLNDAGSAFYSVRATGGAPGAWEVRARVVNMGEVGFQPSPGQTVTLEGRSYFNGALADGGVINGSVTTVAGVSTHTDPLAGTKLSTGTYRYTFTVPNVTETTYYGLEVKLGTGILDPTDQVPLSVSPFTVLVNVVAHTNTSATVKVLVGGSAPIAGATVSIQGDGVQLTPPYLVTVGPFTATTDAHGAATVNAKWNATSSYLSFTMTVTSGGKTVKELVGVTGSDPHGWTPMPNSAFGCSVASQTDPATLSSGQTATLKFRVTENGTNVASHSIAKWAWRDGASGAEQSGNVTTDATGNFTMTYAFAANWTSSDKLTVKVLCPAGESDADTVTPATTSGFGFGTGHLAVTAGAASVGGTTAVTATYTGMNALNGASAMAFIVPGNATSNAGYTTGSGMPFGAMTKSGATFTGSVSIPSWYPEGDYAVVVIVSNHGAAPTTTEEFTEGNATAIHVGAAGGPGGGGTTGGKGFLPGFDGLAAIAAVGAGAAVLAVGRKRRLE